MRMVSSHGFYNDFVSANLLEKLLIKTNNFLDSKKDISNYYANMNNIIPDYELILNKGILKKVNELISTSKPILSAVELHVQLPNCEPIPPHQDNFYHCIKPPEYGVKILVPLSKLNSQNGGLSFLDIPINFPVIDHIPSKIKNFSSILPKKNFKKINSKIISYEYNQGDISYHYLNSIHFSSGNKTKKKSSFLVFRFENPESYQDKFALKKYISCSNKHKEIFNQKFKI